MLSAHIGSRTASLGARRGQREPSLMLVPARFSKRFCRRCGAEIAVANLMDSDPSIDRQYFSLILWGGQHRRLLSRAIQGRNPNLGSAPALQLRHDVE